MASGIDVQMFLWPSPSASTANFMKLDGMNCVWPMAPAQEPFMSSPVDMALLQDHERGEEFVAEEVAAVLLVGERRERADDVLAAGERAEVGLHAPDAEDDGALDAVAALDRGEGRGPAGWPPPRPARCAVARDGAVHVLPDRLHELGLLVRELDDLGIGRHARERALEGGAGHAALLRLRPQRVDEGARTSPGCGRVGGSRRGLRRAADRGGRHRGLAAASRCRGVVGPAWPVFGRLAP